MDVATFAPTLAAMIGLGVGIDYALLVMNRYRQGLLHGHDPKQAAIEAVQTAGRAVLFAGSTVIIALLGLFVMRISFFNGLSLAAAVTVLFVMLSALWRPAVEPAGQQGTFAAPALGEEARRHGRPPGGQGLGALRPRSAEAPAHSCVAGPGGGRGARHPDVQPAAGLRG